MENIKLAAWTLEYYVRPYEQYMLVPLCQYSAVYNLWRIPNLLPQIVWVRRWRWVGFGLGTRKSRKIPINPGKKKFPKSCASCINFFIVIPKNPESLPIKGQLNSEWLLDVFIWTKERTKTFLYCCPTSLKNRLNPKKKANYYIRR